MKFKEEYYIVDCLEFVFFARIVHVIGYDSDGRLETDVESQFERYGYRFMYKEELERFKTFEDAQKEAKRLNNLPENIKSRERWNANRWRIEYFKNTGEII